MTQPISLSFGIDKSRWPMGSGKSVYPDQLALNKIFDPSTPSMRKGCDGGEMGGKRGKKEKNYENSGH